MKKSKILMGICALLLSAVFMITVITSPNFGYSRVADVKVEGVTGRFDFFREKIIGKLINENSNSEPVKNSEILPEVYAGGYPVGLKLYSDGVVIVGTEAVDTENGYVNTAEKAGLRVGDVIKQINGETVTTNSRVSQLIEESEGNVIQIDVERDENLLSFTFNSEFSVSEEKYKAGIWVRDSSAGIGTVTFCTTDGYFASLGHAVCDIDTNDVVPIAQGESTAVSITGFTKSTAGSAGELCGVLEAEQTGVILDNGDLGVYGKFDEKYENDTYPIASKSDVRKGEAYIYTSLENNGIEKYSAKIVELYPNSNDNKNLVIEITDSRLLEKTGGIIQGMSGSPVIQDGKLVGAITHVLIDEPSKGYGVFAQTMFEKLSALKQVS